jgi:hypothetical protein
MGTRTALIDRGKKMLAGADGGAETASAGPQGVVHRTPAISNSGICQTAHEAYPPQPLPSLVQIATTMYTSSAENGIEDVSADAIVLMAHALEVIY